MSETAEEARAAMTRRMYANVAANLNGYFARDTLITKNATKGWPTWAQSIRIEALIKNKRILVADDTGINGKTFTAVASKISLDRDLKRRNPTLVVAPNSGMINAWNAEEINRYASHLQEREQNVLTLQSYKDLEKITPEHDFVIFNWEKLSIRSEDSKSKLTDPRWHLLDAGIQKLNPSFYVLDECHNAKGAQSLRSGSIRKLTQHSIDKYLMLLSATPIPNRYHDLGMIFHMLDPVTYSDLDMFRYCGPAVIKELLDRRVWFRLTREMMKEELGLPDLKEVEIPVILSDTEAHAYFNAWADCVQLGEGLTELRNILYDARLSKYGKHLGQEFMPSKMTAVKNLVGQLRQEGQKIILKTNFVKGVLEPYTQMLQEYGNVLVMSGETSLTERRDAVKLFQNSNEHNILFTSQVGEESMDMTTGEQPCAQIPLEPEISPREHVQFTGRTYRRGQKGNVTHYTLVTQSDTLNKLMTEQLSTIAKQYGCKIPKKFRPRTIDSDMLAMRKAKIQIVDKIYSGCSITTNEQKLYDADATLLTSVNTTFEGLLAPTTFKNISPFALSTLIQARWRNLGEEQFGELIKTRGWQKWCRLYEEGWEGSASQATLQAIGRVIDSIETKLAYYPTIVDLGSGAAYLSRATGRRAICVDIDNDFLSKGQTICDKLGITNSYVPATATNTGLPTGNADIVVNAYMLFYLGQDGKRNEIEQSIMETNRIAKIGGEFILGLPYTVDDCAIERFSDNLQHYGLGETKRLAPSDTRMEHMKNGCHLLVYKKVKDVLTPPGLDLSFYDNKVRLIQ